MPLPKVDSEFYRAQQEDSAPDAYNSAEDLEEASSGLQLLQDIQETQPQPARRQLSEDLSGLRGYIREGRGQLGRQFLGAVFGEAAAAASKEMAMGAKGKVGDGADPQRDSVKSGDTEGRLLDLQKAAGGQVRG